MPKPYRIVYLGMLGVYSTIPFKALLDAGANIVGVVIPRPRQDKYGPKILPPIKTQDSELRIFSAPQHENIQTLANQANIPILSVSELADPESVKLLADFHPDLVLTVCFPKILPESWLSVPTRGSMNLHPSLLPAYRGRHPLFWQFRNAEPNTGVTLHFMDMGIDSGDIVVQKKVDFPKGITGVQADQIAAKVGAEIILDVLSMDKFPSRPQGIEGASFQSAPTPEDRTISIDWEVQRAFNFLRGADEWAPFWYQVSDGEEVEINQAVSYMLGKKNSAVSTETAEGIELQFIDGVLLIR